MKITNPKRLFLVDSLGALLSAILLGLVLARFEPVFGMSRTVLYLLSVIPCIYSIYSFLCFFIEMKNWKPYMKIIATANLLYCCLTLGLIILHNHQLTILGLIYFVLEIIIVTSLAIIELKTASN